MKRICDLLPRARCSYAEGISRFSILRETEWPVYKLVQHDLAFQLTGRATQNYFSWRFVDHSGHDLYPPKYPRDFGL